MVHRCVARLTKSADVLHDGTMGLSALLSETFRGQIFAGKGASTLILWLNDRLSTGTACGPLSLTMMTFSSTFNSLEMDCLLFKY